MLERAGLGLPPCGHSQRRSSVVFCRPSPSTGTVVGVYIPITWDEARKGLAGRGCRRIRLIGAQSSSLSPGWAGGRVRLQMQQVAPSGDLLDCVIQGVNGSI